MKQAEFAALVGVSVQTISAWISEGRLRRGDTALGWLRAYLEWLREQAAGRGTENPLTAARARLAQAQAVRAETLSGRLSGQLIVADDARRGVYDAFRALRDAVLRVPRKVCGLGAGLEADSLERLISDELRKTLHDFSNQRIAEAGNARMGSDA